jgi:VWFA-related protein
MIVAVLALAAASSSVAQEPVREQVTVSQVEVTLHVTDKAGNVIPNLKKEDFRLFVDGQPQPIESLEWVGTVSAAVPERTTTVIRSDVPAPIPVAEPAGRLIVMIFQSHIEGQKDDGLMRMKRQALEFLESLQPEDRVAVLTEGSRLWLNLDFTSDVAAIRKAIHTVPRKQEIERPENPGLYSIGAHLSLEQERAATSMEKGLAAVGRALRPLPGSKAVLFFGYGVGRYNAYGSAANYSMGRFESTPDLEAAQKALAAAQAPVFSLDVSSGSHSLEAGLKQLSFDTGGFYMRTENFPRWAMGAVREAIKGHYAVVFVKPSGQPGPHKITIELMRGAAVLLYRQEYDDSGAAAPPGR